MIIPKEGRSNCALYIKGNLILIDLSLPNKETAKAIEEARKGEGIVRCKDVDDMFDKLGSNWSEIL